jgi:hypothetical protein
MVQRGVGDIILQAAQGIIAQQQANQQLELKAAEMEEQFKQQEKNFDLRQKELDLRDRAIAVQEGQAQRADALSPLKIQQAEKEIEKTESEIELLEARTKAQGASKGPGSLTANQQLNLNQTIESKAIRLEMNQAASAFEASQEQGGIRLPRLGSAQEYMKLRRSMQRQIADFQTSKSAQEARLVSKISGSDEEFEIDKVAQDLKTLESFMGSEAFLKMRDQHDLEGPSPEAKQAIGERLFPGFEGAVQTQQTPPPAVGFNFGSVPSDKVENSWALFSSGNVDPLVDDLLTSTEGKFTAKNQREVEAELAKRFPTPGREQDEAIQSWNRALQKIKAQRVSE